MWTRRGFGLAAGSLGLAAAGPLRAQDALDLSDRLYGDGLYLPQYLDLKARAATGDGAARGMLSQFSSFVGDEQSAIGTFERPPALSVSRPDLASAESRDALEAIVEGARTTRVVILNEAHNISGHRAFAARVARGLRPLGYDWFAAETFTPPQGEPAPSIGLYREGMPFISGFGYYTIDPVYAETVRDAARLGYRFSDYEWTPAQRSPDDATAEVQIATREEAQADNLIANVLGPNPDARVFVYVGYSHAMEKPGRGGTWFAARLKDKTGIDPLTIEQSGNWPALDPANDAPHVAAVLERFAPDRPIVVSSSGVTIANATYAGQMDLSVFHPRREPVSGRPGWLAADPARHPFTVEVPAFEGAALLQAIRTGEGPAGVPADQILLRPGQARATFFLYPGSYYVRMERESGIDPAYGRIKIEAA